MNNIIHEVHFLRGLLKGAKKLHKLRKGWKSIYLVRVLAVYLVIDLLLNFLVALPLFSFFESYYDTYIDLDESGFELLLYGVLIVPVIEELIFRWPMTLAKNRVRSSRFLFWLLTCLFALAHIFNYDFSSIPTWVYPFMVLPQFITGVLLGVVRIRFGLIYSIILHTSFNLILIVPEVIWPS